MPAATAVVGIVRRGCGRTARFSRCRTSLAAHPSFQTRMRSTMRGKFLLTPAAGSLTSKMEGPAYFSLVAERVKVSFELPSLRPNPVKTRRAPKKEHHFTGANGANGARPDRATTALCWPGASRALAHCSLCYLRSLLFTLVRIALPASTVVLLPPATQAQGAVEAWVQRYNGPANGNDVARAMALDASGNVYVTGASDDSSAQNPQGVTLAYSSSGAPLWTNVYTAEGLWAYGNAVAADSGGNVYVAGRANHASDTPSCTTFKYSSAGVLLWADFYRVSASPTDGWAVALDPSGNVVVMGSFDYGWSCVTIKYSSAGERLWTRTYSSYRPNAMAVDASGNVVVTGSRRVESALLESYLTLKYSSTGALLWTRTYSSPGIIVHEGSAVAVDSQGNVVVTGRSSGDYATIKYSGEGVALWTNRYNGTGNDNDEARAVAVDATGSVVVTGWSVGAGSSSDYLTIKYSGEGVPLWTNRYNGPGGFYGPGNGRDRATAMAVDGCGNVFVTGWSDNGADYWDYATIAYSSTGMPLWTNRYNGPGNKRDEPRAVAVDASGSVYVTGGSEALGSGEDPATQNSDFATVKYVIPPIITRQPLSCSNAVGTTASFTVEVAGSAPFGYQWRRDGTNLVNGGNLSGATTTNLLIANVQLADAAGYTVVLTNAFGSVTSTVAQLTVIIPPSPGRFAHVSYSPDTGFSFIFRDATVSQPYRIQRSSTMAEGSWTTWQSLTYTEPIFLTDMSATGAPRRFYRAVSP